MILTFVTLLKNGRAGVMLRGETQQENFKCHGRGIEFEGDPALSNG